MLVIDSFDKKEKLALLDSYLVIGLWFVVIGGFEDGKVRMCL